MTSDGIVLGAILLYLPLYVGVGGCRYPSHLSFNLFL